MNANSTEIRSTSNIIYKSKKKCFSTDNVKKRGVFVERNAVSSLLDGNDVTNEQHKRKAPPRSRPGQKKFLSSVLTILSKSTVSTQYPAVTEDKDRKPKPRRLKTYKTEAENSKITYKSSVLNKKVVTEEDFVILKYKKDIAQTPSNYSERSKVENFEKESTIYKEVLEGKKFRNNHESTVTELSKNDDKLYNLFVDLLLESTLNINNVQANHENQLKNNDSNTILEINEDVAKKLEIKANINEEQYTVETDKIDLEDDTYSEIEDKPINIKLSNTFQPKIKAKSFVHAKKRKTLPKSKSFEAKKAFAKSKNNNLLNILKEQLELDISYEEPQNLFEALRVMSKNKQRSEKSLEYHKEVSTKFAGDGRRSTKCMLGRRNLFPKTIRKRKTSKASSKQRIVDRAKPKKIMTNVLKAISSYKSVEVYGYNYEETKKKDVPKLTIFAYHTPSGSDIDYYS